MSGGEKQRAFFVVFFGLGQRTAAHRGALFRAAPLETCFVSFFSLAFKQPMSLPTGRGRALRKSNQKKRTRPSDKHDDTLGDADFEVDIGMLYFKTNTNFASLCFLFMGFLVLGRGFVAFSVNCTFGAQVPIIFILMFANRFPIQYTLFSTAWCV
jgi:hypothetical protein